MLCVSLSSSGSTQTTQPTQEKNQPGKVAGGEELDSFNSICVFHIAWTLFVHATWYTSSTHNKSLSTKLEKIKTENTDSFMVPLWSQHASHLGFMEYLSIANTHWQLLQFRDTFTTATWAARSKILVYNTEISPFQLSEKPPGLPSKAAFGL